MSPEGLCGGDRKKDKGRFEDDRSSVVRQVDDLDRSRCPDTLFRSGFPFDKNIVLFMLALQVRPDVLSVRGEFGISFDFAAVRLSVEAVEPCKLLLWCVSDGERMGANDVLPGV